MQYVLVLAVLAAVFALVTGPLRALRHERSDIGDEVANLEAARDAKYQEIRDAELDMRTGKLSDEDYEAIDQTLRAEAIEILQQLDDAEAADAAGAEAEDDELAQEAEALAHEGRSTPDDHLPSRP